MVCMGSIDMSVKKGVDVYLSSQQIRILEILCRCLGMDKSAVLRLSFLQYAKDVHLISEAMHGQPIFYERRISEMEKQIRDLTKIVDGKQ
ncbi:hypothetical protein ES708_23497 [subsurface metagenome]